jgi:hypothetical protein
MDKETRDYINSELVEMGKNIRTDILENEIKPLKENIGSLREALARVAHGSPHLTPEEQAKIKELLGIG